MSFDANLGGWLLLIAMFFVGRFSGIASEMKDWMDSCVEKRPIVKKGMVFRVKYLGGDE